MPGNYSHISRSDGTILSAALYNADHVNHITNQTPAGTDDFQTTLGEKQTQTNPSSGLATSLAGDLAQLRDVLNRLGGGTTFWYEVGGPPFHLLLMDTAVAAVGVKKVGVLVPRPGVITKVLAFSDVAPTGADLIFDVNKNGTTIFTTPGNRVKILAGAFAGNQTTIEVNTLGEGDRIDLDIDQVGSGVAGGNWSRVLLLVKPAAP